MPPTSMKGIVDGFGPIVDSSKAGFSPIDLIKVVPLCYCILGACWGWLGVRNTVYLIFLLALLLALSMLHRKLLQPERAPLAAQVIKYVKWYVFALVLLTAGLTLLRNQGAKIVEDALNSRIKQNDIVFYLNQKSLESGRRRKGAEVNELLRGRDPSQLVVELTGVDSSISNAGSDGRLVIAKLARPQHLAPLPPPADNNDLPHVLCIVSGDSFRELCVNTVFDTIGDVLGELIQLSTIAVFIIAIAIVLQGLGIFQASVAPAVMNPPTTGRASEPL